nr:putative RNA-directed DNA polymerase [Tanacetum cinerariifolium]
MHFVLMRDNPWTLMGDFNAALNLEDHSSGGYEPNVAMRDFKERVNHMEVMDINYVGIHFTWNQKPKGSNGVLKKNDRIMGNLKFNDDYPGSFAIFQPYRISDHSLSGWNLHLDGFNMYRVVKRLKGLKSLFRKLLNDQEAALDEECFLKQKSKVEWLNVGDSNTTYFHSIVKSKCAKSHIEMVRDASNNFYEGNDVADAFVKRYESFLGSAGNVSLLDDHDLYERVLDTSKADNMVRGVMDSKIKNAMFSIRGDKAPSPDGFTVAFFKKAWDVVGTDITCVIRDSLRMIMDCVTGASFSVCVKGNLQGWFNGKGGFVKVKENQKKNKIGSKPDKNGKHISQTCGIDYTEVFAHVARLETVRLVISLAAQNDWVLFQLDVKSAFLHGELNDLFFTGNDKQMYVKFKTSMMNEFDMTDLGKVRYFLGIEVRQSEAGIFICQKRYAQGVLERFNMDKCNSVQNPIVPGCQLTRDEKGVTVDNTRYKQLIGSLMYLMSKRVLRYIKGTIGLGILYKKGGKKDGNLVVYTDCDYARDLDDRKSTPGYVFLLNSGVVSWSSKKQLIVTLSTTEAEFVAAASCACQAVWLRRIMEYLDHVQNGSTTIFCDNSSIIELSRNPVLHGRNTYPPTIELSVSNKSQFTIICLRSSGNGANSPEKVSNWGSQSSQFGEFVSHELWLKREAAEKPFEASKDKDETIKSLEELRFLALSTKDLSDNDAYWIERKKAQIKAKLRAEMPMEPNNEDDSDE